MKTGILILLLSLFCFKQTYSQGVPENLALKKLDGKEVFFNDARATAKVKSLVKGKKWPFEVLLDANKELYKAFNISAVPYVVIINDGKVVWSHSGYMPGNEVEVVEKALEYVKKNE